MGNGMSFSPKKFEHLKKLEKPKKKEVRIRSRDNVGVFVCVFSRLLRRGIGAQKVDVS